MMQASASSPLLATKLYLPRARPNRVERPRLIARLNEAMSQQLTLICAPPGFGKTTLLSDWIPYSENCVTWLSLDEADNDPARFWTYFIAAVQMLKSGLGESALNLLNAPHPKSPPLESVLTALLNDIAAFHDEFALVLEDYHVIESQTIHEALIFLIEHLPRQIHLILTSRIDPPLPLARFRARNQLAEIRSADLRFTPGEAAVFLNQVMGLNLSGDDIARLEARTEGWIAGLQLAALAMRDRADLAGFIASFTGSQRYIASYLVEEVLHRQPDSMQSFLLQTSILDRMTAALCAAMYGELPTAEPMTEREAQEALESLETANLFLVPLDNEQHWYRYHNLFAEMLRGHLQIAHANRVPNLHNRAAGWFESNGLITEAIQHRLAGRDWQNAVRLILETADPTAFKQGQFKTVLGWLESLPEEVLRSQPRLNLVRGWILLTAGSIEAVEAHLLEAERALPALDSEERLPLQGEVATLRAMIASYRREISRTIELCDQARKRLPESNVSSRAAVANALGLAYRFSGRVVEASQAFSEGIALGQKAGNYYIMMDSVVGLARMQLLRGQLRAAEQTCRQALLFAEEQARASGHPLFDAGFPYVRLGENLRERNELEAAEGFILKGIELGRQGGNLDIVASGNGFLARVRQAQGDPEGALAAMRTVERTAASFDNKIVLLEIAAYSARLSIEQGNLEPVKDWVRQYEAFTDKDPAYLGEYSHITQARLMLAEKRFGEALDLLDWLREDAEAAGRMGTVIEILVLETLALSSQGDHPGALTSLERALTLAEPEGYIRIFLDEGETMRLLLAGYQSVLKKRVVATIEDTSLRLLTYTDKLLAAFTPAATGAAQQPGTAIEPLSERELEILRLISKGLSNQEIAEILVIAVSTVKSHINHLYGKLGTQRRTQAISIARDLGLLEERDF
jgi:LuxR family maltose regulon positive regulatory protein